MYRWFFAAAALLLTACGAYSPPAPTANSAAPRQTEGTLAGSPTLPSSATVVTTAPESAASALPTDPPSPNDLLTFTDDPRALGSPNAPIVMYEFSDFE